MPRSRYLTEIPLPGPRLPHDMAITDHYSVLMDLPLVQDQAARANGKYRIFYDRELPARFAVLPRHGDAQPHRYFSFVNDEASGRAEIDVFDAEDLTAGPVARILLPQCVPSGFHSCWVRADQYRIS